MFPILKKKKDEKQVKTLSELEFAIDEIRNQIDQIKGRILTLQRRMNSLENKFDEIIYEEQDQQIINT